jgi:hypothetical protein
MGSLSRTLGVAAFVACFIFAPTGGPATPGLVAAFAFDEGSGTSVTYASGGGNTGIAEYSGLDAANQQNAVLVWSGCGLVHPSHEHEQVALIPDCAECERAVAAGGR